MPLYEIVKADGSREKVEAGISVVSDQCLYLFTEKHLVAGFIPGTWLEVWRREGVGE